MSRLAILFLILIGLQAYAQDVKPENVKRPKNSVGLELLGNPLGIYYEREILSGRMHSMRVTAGTNLFMLLTYRIPGFSLGTRHTFKMSPSASFFISPRFDFLSIAFPNYSFSREIAYSGRPAGHIFAFNILSGNLGLGILIQKKNWEFAPLYPAALVSFTEYHNGEDGVPVVYPSVSLNSRVAYRF